MGFACCEEVELLKISFQATAQLRNRIPFCCVVMLRTDFVVIVLAVTFEVAL